MKYPETIYVRKDEVEGPISVDSNDTIGKMEAYYCCGTEVEKIVPLNKKTVIGIYKLVDTKTVTAEIVVNE